MPMSPKNRRAWILYGTLLFVIATSTLGGCAATPLGDSRSVEKPAPSQETESSINPSPPELNAWRALRSVMANLYDAGIYFNFYYLGPVLVPSAP
jgi:hypothetical protein